MVQHIGKNSKNVLRDANKVEGAMCLNSRWILRNEYEKLRYIVYLYKADIVIYMYLYVYTVIVYYLLSDYFKF